MICVDIEKIKSRVKDVIEVQNGMTVQPGNDGRNVVTYAEFEKMLDAAMSSGFYASVLDLIVQVLHNISPQCLNMSLSIFITMA